MDCCTPPASPSSGPTWFGQIPGQTSAGPLSRMTSPISLMAKWRYLPPPAVRAAERRKARPPPASVCPRQPMGSLVTLGGRVLMLPAPARAGERHGTFTRRPMWAGCAGAPPPGVLGRGGRHGLARGCGRRVGGLRGGGRCWHGLPVALFGAQQKRGASNIRSGSLPSAAIRSWKKVLNPM